MKILFIHNDFAGQHHHVARFLAADPSNEVYFIFHQHNGKPLGNWNKAIPNIKKVAYVLARNQNTKDIHHYLKRTEMDILHGQAVVRACIEIKKQGFVPDIISCHPGWGAGLFLKDVYPDVPVVMYCENYINHPHLPLESQKSPDEVLSSRIQNGTYMISLADCDAGISPTAYQKQQFPSCIRDKISVIHDGIDTDYIKPITTKEAFKLSNGTVITPEMEIVTYNSRAFERARGFQTFMEAAAMILKQRPNSQIIVSGGQGECYTSKIDEKDLIKQLGLDTKRIHFLGNLPYDQLIYILQRSDVHIYLTMPFILSWSFMEALAAGCLVIGSSTEPVMEVIQDGENGLLVDFFKPEELATRVSEVLDHPDKMKHIRYAARQTILDNYSVQKVIPKHIAMLKNTLNASKPQNSKQALADIFTNR